MDRRVLLKRFITDTKNWLSECGAEYVKKSSDSNSIYMCAGGTKIRVSDHLAGFVVEDQLNVIFSTNNVATPVVIYNNAVLSYQSFKDLKSFLKSFCEMRLCEYFSKDAKMDQNIMQKQAKYNIIVEDIKKKSTELDKLTSKIATDSRVLEKTCRKLEKVKGLGKEINEIDVSKLSSNQKKQIMELILTYKH